MIVQNIEQLASVSSIVAYAKEKGIINMAESFSDLKCDPELSLLLQKYIVPFANTLSPAYGIPELRTAISKKTEAIYDFSYDPELEVSITSGVKQALYASILALLKEGDEVIIFEPAHKNYESAINITGAKVVYVELKPPGFVVNWEEVQKSINQKTRMIIINNPHFPTGSTLSELDMLRLQKTINGTNILILSDESFEHIVFDKEMHQSVSLYPKLRERSVIISSFDESINIRSWRIGYCLSTKKMMAKIRKVIPILGEGITVPYQMAIAEYVNDKKDFKKLLEQYQKKRDLLVGELKDSKVQVIPSRGSYFQLISCLDRSDTRDVDFAMKLLKDFDVAAVPISFYYHQKTRSRHIRLNLSLPDEVILDVAKKLKSILCCDQPNEAKI